MNSESDTSPEMPNESQPTVPAAMPATRPLYWSVWREMWENRSIYIAPLSVAVVVLFGFMISTYGMPERRQAVLLQAAAKQRTLIREPYETAPMMFFVTLLVVCVVSCLPA